MADLYTPDLEDNQNSDEGLGCSGSEGGSSGGDMEDEELGDEPSNDLEHEICQGARLDLLEEHQRSDNPYHRQAVVRTLQSSLRSTGGLREDAERLLNVAVQLAADVVDDIRCDLADQVPHLAQVCASMLDEQGQSLMALIPTHLLVIVLQLLSDQNKMIHKTAQGALLVLLEHGYLPADCVEEKLVPLVVTWALVDDVELNSASVGLMTKMAPIIGEESSCEHFLNHFSDLCRDQQLYVRKVCATNFGDFSAAVGQAKAEEVLIPKFLELCRDNEWAVRKACAEVFTSVSHTVTLERRRAVLALTFNTLLRDESRWVQVAAFQSLGSFIATFGDSGHLNNAHHVLLDTEGVELAYRAEVSCSNPALRYSDSQSQMRRFGGGGEQNLPQACQQEEDEDDDEEEDEETKMNELERHFKNLDSHPTDWEREEWEYHGGGSVFLNMSQQPPPPPPPEADDEDEEPTVSATLQPADQPELMDVERRDEASGEVVCLETLAQQSKVVEVSSRPGEEDFNTFQYWRLPVPELDLNDILPPPPPPPLPVSIIEAPQPALCDTSLEPPMSPLASLMPDHLPSPVLSLALPPAPSVGEQSPAPGGEDKKPAVVIPHDDLLSQDIVPDILIKHFVSMATSKARGVDPEISHHCAFSLPAVVLTLGRENWSLLRDTYKSLAADMQWKVRRTMASSMHEVASILGKDLASKDLMPIFNDFVKDLDEVRIGVLKHLTEFLKLLHKEECDEFLPDLSKFLQMDHLGNWRYREELAHQLMGILDLCNPEQARAHVAPIALALMDDKVAAVRCAALPLTTKVTRKLAEEEELLDRLMQRFHELFVCTERWMRRQSFAVLCGQLLQPPEPALSPELFLERMLPLLAGLACDSVPNVRLAVAQSITRDIEPHPYFSKPPGLEKVQEILAILRADSDRDVKFFAGGSLETSLEELEQVCIGSPLGASASLCLEVTDTAENDMDRPASPPQLRV